MAPSRRIGVVTGWGTLYRRISSSRQPATAATARAPSSSGTNRRNRLAGSVERTMNRLAGWRAPGAASVRRGAASEAGDQLTIIAASRWWASSSKNRGHGRPATPEQAGPNGGPGGFRSAVSRKTARRATGIQSVILSAGKVAPERETARLATLRRSVARRTLLRSVAKRGWSAV